jgi:hypothetical protein
LFPQESFSLPCPGSNVVAGTAFRDYDGDGIRDTHEPVVTTGTISAYSGSTSSSTTLATDGTYCITPPSFPTRIELLGTAGYLKQGAVGTNSDTSVRFVPTSGSSVDFALQNPADFCQSNP